MSTRTRAKRALSAVAAALTTALLCSGCYGAAREQTGDVVLRVAGQNADDHPHSAELAKMAQAVEEGTDGRVTMEVYPNNQLGDYVLMYDEISQGTVDMGLISAPTHLDNRLEVQYLPYIVSNYDEVNEHFSLDSFLGQKVCEIHNEQGIELLGLFAEGFGGIATSKPAADPADPTKPKDVRVRVPEITATAEHSRDLGFTTVSMSYADVYQGLQTGTVEGWIGGHPLVNYLQFRDVIDYYYEYNNTFEATHLLINAERLDGLSEADQQVIYDAGRVLTENSYELAESLDAEYLEKLDEFGIEVVEFSDEEIAEIADYSRKEGWPVLDDPRQQELLGDLADAPGIEYK